MKHLLTLTLVSGLACAAPVFAGEGTKPAPSSDKSAGEPTQETSEGTLKLFIAAMRKGDFARTVELCDPGAEEFDNLQKMAEAFDEKDPANQAPDKKQVLDVVRDFFTKPWKDVEYKLEAEQGPRAQYTLTFFYIDEKDKQRKKGETRTVDLNQFEGKWRVLVSSQVMKPAVPNSLPAQPPSEKPAEKQ